MSKKYLVTSALTYANGALHLGHLLEYIQTDTFVRALKMMGEDVVYVAGIDAHGTAIEVNAAKAKVSPEQFVKSWHTAYEKTLATFQIAYDAPYGSTHTEYNENHATHIYNALLEAGHIFTKEVEQLYDPESKRFLPDRYVKGTCPKCKQTDQYGDACESCGTTYRPTELLDPKSILSGATPVLKSSKHYFFQLACYTEQLQKWTSQPGVLHGDVQNYLQTWFKDGLKDWDISRDGPYFGFKIPGETDKYFYVWLDAPIGYISITEQVARKKGRTFEDYWKNKETEIFHFIGKDIVYFHTLFWPAMLMGAGYTLPKAVCVHGMLTINGEKMSKSRGTFILGDQFAQFAPPETLRYYFGCKLSPRVEDIDLNLEDFVARINADLVNKIVNLLSRSVPMLHRFFQGLPTSSLDPAAEALRQEAEQTVQLCKELYRQRDFSQVTKTVVSLSESANRYLQEKAPWDTVKTHPQQAQQELTTAIWVGKIAVGLLQPVIPGLAKQVEEMLVLKTPFRFDNLLEPLAPTAPLLPYTRLLERLDMNTISKVMDTPLQEAKGAAPSHTTLISIEDFARMELRAAKVLDARTVEGADKLLSIDLDVGELGKRHVFSGLRPHVAPEDLHGKTVLLVSNLAPRKMRFGVSEGMILACGSNPVRPVFLDNEVPSGTKVS